MNPQSAKRSLAHLCERKVPVFLWGPPGIGKSSIVTQIAREAGIGALSAAFESGTQGVNAIGYDKNGVEDPWLASVAPAIFDCPCLLPFFETGVIRERS